MRGLDLLRQAVDGAAVSDPTVELEQLAKTFQRPVDVAKRKTPGDEIPLKGLQVDPDYQRPPDRDKIAAFVEHRRAGKQLPPIKVNERPDGSRWITDGQHRAAAARLCGDTHIDGIVTHVPQQDEPQETNIVAKVAADADGHAITRLLGAGARRQGKRLVLSLGRHGDVTYTPHGAEWVGKTDRGALLVDAPDARRVLDRLGITDLRPEIRAADLADDAD